MAADGAHVGLRVSLLSDVVEALGLPSGVLPGPWWSLDDGCAMIGRAFPVLLEPMAARADEPYDGLLASLEAIGEGEIYVISSRGCPDGVAIFGELMANACGARGAAGALCDGLIRDRDAIRRFGYPCFHRGASPLDMNGRAQVVAHGRAVLIGEVVVRHGDLVVADDDGVIAIPAAAVDEVLTAAAAKNDREVAFRTAIADGLPPSEAWRRFRVM
jgi:4-hydroxy-4-methyl-2-oxoglutarate aldolase